MRFSIKNLFAALLLLAIAFPAENSIAKKEEPKPDESKGKQFGDVIKDYSKIEGLFTFYTKSDEGKVYLAIKPDQLNKIFLCGITRSAGDGTFYDNSAQDNEFPFEFKRVGKTIQLVQINLRFRADSTSALSRAIDRGVSNSIFGVAKIESLPDKDTQALLVDPTTFFIQDVDNTTYFLGKEQKLEYSFDRENSYFATIKSFPLNSEFDVNLHFRTSKPNGAQTFPSPYSMILTYHYSLSQLTQTDYKPRLADDRVGYFQTIYQDYTHLDSETPYVRYVSRWNLQKSDPKAPLSPPKEPIVFWMENTIPVEYRPYVEKGILAWNKAFEKAGFKDAVVVKQMPDTASWDPADIRYNTVRWMLYPGGTYAVGPSRTNPFTGQIYDADIRVCADLIRYLYMQSQYTITPIKARNGNQMSDDIPNPYNDNFAEESANDAAFGYDVLWARSDFADKDSITTEFVQSYIVDLVMHEVGHTLGLRHNFKASSVRSNTERHNKMLTSVEGLTGSTMDYNPANIAPKGVEQGEYFHSVPGAYDLWAIEYGYTPTDAATPEAEKPALDKIASRCAEPQLIYATDEDVFGNSTRAIDPLCSQFDMSSDPIAYYKDEISLTKELWGKIEEKFGKDGNRYQMMMSAFDKGWRSYRYAAMLAPKFISGVYRYNDHVGDSKTRLPFEPVSAAKQKEAMKFLKDYILAPDAFQFPSSLLNKLQPERMEDFGFSAGSIQRLDYPIHDVVFAVQKRPIDRLYDPLVLSRMQDIELRYAPGAEKYTMADMFPELRDAIWSELTAGTNINSFRRDLQRYHLEKLIGLMLDKSLNIPEDARNLARNDMKTLQKRITDSSTQARLESFHSQSSR